MGSNVFETEVGRSFREAHCFVHKFVDGLYASRPGDFIVLWRGQGFIIEAKTTTASTFPLSGWTKSQRAHCDEVTKSGGYYWLLVNFRNAGGRKGMTMAYRAVDLQAVAASTRASLKPSAEFGISLASQVGGWNVGPILYLSQAAVDVMGER